MIALVNTILMILFSVFEGILSVCSEAVVTMIPTGRKDTYDAQFDRPANQLRRNGTGISIGDYYSTGSVEAHSHVITLGGSGSNKSSSICFPTLLRSQDCSYVVHDYCKELSKAARHMQSNDFKILYLDYDDLQQSIGFNFFSHCKGEADVAKGIHTICANGMPGPRDYWTQSAEQVIILFATALWQYGSKEYVNMYNLANIVDVYSYSPEAIERWVIRTGDARLISQLKALAVVPGKTLQSTLATAKTMLAIYRSDAIARLTATNTITDFDTFRREKTALFIRGNPSTARLYRSVTASLCDTLFSHLLNRVPGRDELPVTFLLDEANLIRLEDTLPTAMALGRKHRISIVTLWQDFNQVEAVYGKHEAATIYANSRFKVYMPSGQPLATCEMLSRQLGKYEVKTENGTRIRELLTAQEIFQLQKVLVLNGNNKPMLLDPRPYYLNPKLKALTEMEPLHLKGDVPDVMPSLMTFE